MGSLWIYGLVAAGLYCICRAALDLRAKRHVWAALGLLSGVTILMAPIPTQAVSFDLPVPAAKP